jgi:hypothetical protein
MDQVGENTKRAGAIDGARANVKDREISAGDQDPE